MSIDTLRDALPAYAKDLSLNVSGLVNDTTLNDEQKWGCFIACAYAMGEPTVLHTFNEVAVLDEASRTAAKAAAAIMGMNNVYYRSLHLMHNPEYQTMPAKLRMNIIGSPGVDKALFELWCTSVSAINGCGACLDAHEAELRKHSVQPTQIQTALRIASVVHAVARVLTAEAAAKA